MGTQKAEPVVEESTDAEESAHVEAVLSKLRPNWPKRIARGTIVTCAIVTAGIFGFGAIGWWRWLGGVVGGLLGLSSSEVYEWLEKRSDDARFRVVVEEAGRIYASEGEEAAADMLRDRLADFEKAARKRDETFAAKVGDVDAVAAQAQDAGAAAVFATKSVAKTNEHLEVLIDRVETVDTKVNALEDSSAKTHKNILSRLGRLRAEGVSVEAVETKLKTGTS